MPLYILCYLPHTRSQLFLMTLSPFLWAINYCMDTFNFVQLGLCRLRKLGFTPSHSLMLLEVMYHKSSSFMLKKVILIRQQCLL